jgi:hypothetical protein
VQDGGCGWDEGLWLWRFWYFFYWLLNRVHLYLSGNQIRFLQWRLKLRRFTCGLFLPSQPPPPITLIWGIPALNPRVVLYTPEFSLEALLNLNQVILKVAREIMFVVIGDLSEFRRLLLTGPKFWVAELDLDLIWLEKFLGVAEFADICLEKG